MHKQVNKLEFVGSTFANKFKHKQIKKAVFKKLVLESGFCYCVFYILNV
jgi:hypothetical protein